MFRSLILWLEVTCNTDPAAFTVISLMCMVGAYMVKDALMNPNGAFLIYPFLVVLSILTNWVFAQFGVFDMKKMDLWLVAVTMSSAIGMIIGLSLFVLLMRGVHKLADRHA
jgi:hypothetical protein